MTQPDPSPKPPKGPGLTDKDYQILAAIRLLEANGYKVMPVVSKKGKKPR